MSGAFKPYLAYSASAGSGKTFALSVRYVALLFLGVDPRTILAATFTNKAAAEMKQRVINSLVHLRSNPIFLDQIVVQTGLTREEILERQPAVLEHFLSSSNFIVTLDSFFTSILRSASLYVDLEPDFVTKEIDPKEKERFFLDEIQANGMLMELVHLVMNIEDKRFLKIFELMQNFYKIDPLLPTQEYSWEEIYPLEEQIDQKREQMYALLLEVKASKSALGNFMPLSVKDLFKKPLFKKESLLEHNHYRKAVEKNPQIEEEFLQIKGLLGRWARLKESQLLHHLFLVFSYYKNANIGMAKQLGVLSFDDLSYFTYRLLHESINREFLYFKIDSRFHHILLDEFQDTSTLQFLLLKPLIDEIFAGVGQEEFKSLFYVGDTKQSLYRFRGGVEALFGAVASNYGIEIAQMQTNYRSAKQIVKAVNRWFEPSMEGFYPAAYREDASEGYVEVVVSDELIDTALEKLMWLLDRGAKLEDIAFLVSTNKDGTTLQEACYAKGVATRLKTSSSLKHTAKIAALVAMVRYLFNGEELDSRALLERVRVEEVDLSWFNHFMDPLEVLHRLIGEFGYFQSDLNLLKLLEFAGEFSDIATFLEEFEHSSIDVASHTKEGAMIMTIHGSKGLEFEHVIVLDRFKKSVGDRSVLLYDYDQNLHVKQIFYKMRGREAFDPEYARLLKEQQALVKKDQMNVLYVALTRAIESMVVICKSKDSIFAPLGLTQEVVGRLAIVSSSSVEAVVEEEVVPLSNYGTQEVGSNGSEEPQDHQAMLFGTALHYTLEMLYRFDLDSLAEALLATQNRFGLMLDEVDLSAIEQRVRNLLEDVEFLSLLEGATLFKEQSLSFNGEFKQIDLLLEKEEEMVVVDYKSSTKFQYKHEKQVREYMQAIEEITQKPTRGVVVYLLEEGVVLHNVEIK